MSKATPNTREKSFGEGEIIVSKTDTKGDILYGNEIFIELSGYAEEELLGQPHNIIRHPDMPRVVFKLLWDTLHQQQEIFAYVKNLSKDGSFYWVLANVTPSFDVKGKVIGYHSVRRKPSREAIATIESVYKLLLEAEKRGGMEASAKLLGEFLQQKGMSYEEFVLSL